MKKFLKKINLNKKIIYILGGQGLIGNEIVKLLSKFKCKIIILDNIKPNKSKNIFFFKLDISNLKNIKKSLLQIIKKNGQPDVFINCSYPKSNNWDQQSFKNLDIEEIILNLNLHLSSFMWTSKIFADYMKKKSSGSIILLSSVYGVIAQNPLRYKNLKIQENAIYPAIKGGIISYVRQLASIYGKYNIRVNCISPGGIKSKLKSDLTNNKNFLKNYLKEIPLKKIGTPQDVANLTFFLSSDLSSHITGQNIVLDGGYSII